MCGIFGLVVAKSAPIDPAASARDHVSQLLSLSASRGKEAVGLAINSDDVVVYKEPVAADKFVRSRIFRTLISDAVKHFSNGCESSSLAFIGHSRLVTDGDRDTNRNNQPVVTAGTVGIHNGIVVNHASLWQQHADLKRQYDVDSEVIFALIRKKLGEGLSLEESCAQTFDELEGAASVAALFDDREQLLLATNNGSLYYRCKDRNLLVFASERYILDTFIGRNRELEEQLGEVETVKVDPGRGVVVDLAEVAAAPFAMSAPNGVASVAPERIRTIIDRSTNIERPRAKASEEVGLERLEEQFPYRVHQLRRCSRCVLPESMPYITFDGDGVCNYCRDYQPLEHKGKEALEELLRPHRGRGDRPDCLVALSGGRDSIYGLHYLKCELGVHPISYTYDWGMVTDLARRNISRICGKLGIENILVSADIHRKRDNIRKNVEAWLDKPTLGTVPLFMAGDKAYFHHLKKVQSQTQAPVSFLCENLLERTNFKTGFAGIPPQIGNKEHTYSMQLSGKVQLAKYFLQQFAKNRGYLNSSMLDTAAAFGIYYVQKRTDHNLYSYVPWEESVVNPTLLDEYHFEMSPDTETTWRIGDGTAAFYNYIYYTIAGFTENDTFRSNQIREGHLEREEALRLVERDNRYRLPSIKWYLDTIKIGRSMQNVLRTIHEAPKLY